MSDINFDLGLAIGEFKKATQEATVASKQLSNDFKNNTKSMDKAFDASTKNMGSSWNVFVGTLGVDVFKKVISTMVGVFSTAIDEAAQAEESINNLNVALRQSGNYSKEASKDLQEFAQQLQNTTIYSDDAVLGVISTLEALTDLDKDGLKKVTASVVDFASKYGKGLDEAGTMVARALEGNTVAFSKMGIKIKEGSSQAERMKNVLDALSGSSGAAEQKSNTFSGSMAKLKNQIGETYETLGGFVTNNPQVIQAIAAASNAFSRLGDSIKATGEFIARNQNTVIALATGILSVAAAIATYQTVVKSAAIATAAFNAVLAINPIGLITIAIAGVITGITLFILKFDEINLAFLKFIKNVTEKAILIESAFNKMFGTDLSKMKTQLADINAEIAKSEANIKAKADAAVAANNKELTSDSDTAAGQKKIREQKALDRQASEIKTNAEIALIRRDAANQELINDAENKNSALQENQKFLDEKRLREIEAMIITQEQKNILIIAEIEKRNQERILELEAIQFQEDEKLRIQTEAELAKAKLIDDSIARNKAIEEANAKSKIAKNALDNKQSVDLLKLKHENENTLENKRLQTQKELDANKISNQRDTFATIATMSTSNNKILATIGKAAAMTQIAIDTPVAISKALAAFPPPFNFVAAGLVGTAMAVQASKVAGLQFADGGIVPGSSFSGDRVPANVNSGEMILNRQQQATLFAQANGEGGNSSLASAISALGDRIANMEIKLFTSDSNIALATSRGMQDGILLGISR